MTPTLFTGGVASSAEPTPAVCASAVTALIGTKAVNTPLAVQAGIGEDPRTQTLSCRTQCRQRLPTIERDLNAYAVLAVRYPDNFRMPSASQIDAPRGTG